MRTGDVLIQAGHEGRTSGATGAVGFGLREIDLTPRIADAATALLRDAGFDVIRVGADGLEEVEVKIAIAFHLDGNPNAGAQFLYDDPTDAPLARHLRQAWSAHYAWWIPDNTSPLVDSTGFSRYYGFRYWRTTDAELVMEMGSLGHPTQAALWAQPGYPEWSGRVVGAAIASRLGVDVTVPPFMDPDSPILAEVSAEPEQMLQLWRLRYVPKSAYPEAKVNLIARAYKSIGVEEGVDGAGAYAQALKETGGFSFLTADGSPPASGLSPDQNNFAGIGATGPGVPGERWDTVEAGVRGHIRRLRLYATPADEVDRLGLHDLQIIKRPLPRQFWGSATVWRQLGGKWAPSEQYGESIVVHYLAPLQGTVAPVMDWVDRAQWPDIYRPAIEKAISVGIVKGRPHSPGKVILDGATPISRYEAIVLFDRTGSLD